MKKIFCAFGLFILLAVVYWGGRLTHCGVSEQTRQTTPVAPATPEPSKDVHDTPSVSSAPSKPSVSSTPSPSSMTNVPSLPKIELQEVTFAQLPGWKKANTLKSLQAFQASCRLFLKQSPDAVVGNDFLTLKAKDWHPACRAAVALKSPSAQASRAFFQAWFKPVEFNDGKPVTGLFTGYYFPSVDGSLIKTTTYTVPVYGLPRDRVTVSLRDFDQNLPNRTFVGRMKGGQFVPYYTRKAIDHGAIKHLAPVVAWVKTPLERLILEIEGSGIITLPHGESLFLGYAGGNGAPYTAIGRVLIDQGVMTRDNASMQHIRRYLEENPAQMNAVIHQNKSFVFFRVLTDQKGALGAQGLLLTDGYSLAVDRSWVPLGMPVWLQTTRPDENTEQSHAFTRLMIAQDTGGAIRGAVRGDIFWGAGERATAIAGKMKDQGRYWLLLPLKQKI